MEGRSISDELVEQIVNIELQRAEDLQALLGKDQTEDKSLIANNIILGDEESDVVAGGDDIYHIKLAERADEVFVNIGGGGSALSDTLNFILPEEYADTIQFSFFKGVYDDGGGGTSTPRTFTYSQGETVVEFEFGVSDFVAGSETTLPLDSPSGDVDDLRIQVTFDSNGDNVDETFDLFLLDYFPLPGKHHVLPTYTIAINGGEANDLASFNSEIVELFSS